MKISLAKARRTLARIWFGFAFSMIALMVLQSFFGKYGLKTYQAWGWLLHNIMPTLSLIVGVFASEASLQNAPLKLVSRFSFRLAVWLSVVYLLFVVSVLLLQPFTQFGALEILELSNLWLVPLQALVVGMLAKLFFKSTSNS